MINDNLKIAFFGNSEFSFYALKEMYSLGINFDAIITTKDKPTGRKQILTPTPTKVWAEKNGIAVLEPDKLKDPEFIKTLSDFDLFIVASYGKIIPKVIIDIPKYGTLNIHPSLLPRYRGPSPLQSQILNDEEEIGVSIMQIDEQVDHGPLLASGKVELSDWPVSFDELQKITAKKGADILFESLPRWISGKLKAVEQNHESATFTKKLEKADGLIDPLDTKDYKNFLKYLAFRHWPETYFQFTKDSKKIRVIIKDALWKDGEMQIQRVLPEGKKEMDYKAFLNGHSVSVPKNIN